MDRLGVVWGLEHNQGSGVEWRDGESARRNGAQSPGHVMQSSWFGLYESRVGYHHNPILGEVDECFIPKRPIDS